MPKCVQCGREMEAVPLFKRTYFQMLWHCPNKDCKEYFKINKGKTIPQTGKAQVETKK